jgi:uncharacterized protein with FMN-binding domain
MGLVVKTVSCLVIVASLFYYNQMMKLNEELLEANDTIQEMALMVEEASAAVAAAKTITDGAVALAAEPQGKYKDGVYSGTAEGYGGPVTTELTIENGFIVGIEITESDGEDAAYYNMCLGILDEIVKEQSADVDTVTGATVTSDGIIGGAEKALSDAVKE